jgi:polar amino acid transport system permease protein
MLMMFPYNWDWSVVWDYRSAIARGLLVTLELTAVTIVVGTILGFLLGIFLATADESWTGVKKILITFIDILRSLPLLILILIFNYYAPYIINIGSPFWLAALAMSINLSAFIADVFRAAIEGVPRPLVEAGYAVGMTSGTVTRRILIPEATRQIVPTIALLYIDMLKLSSLASVIAVNEMTHVSTEISAKTYHYLEVFAALAVVYVAIVLPFSIWVRRMEKARWFLRRS